MQSRDMWHGTIGVSIIAVGLAFVGFMAYILYGSPGTLTDSKISESIQTEATPSLLDGAPGALFICADEKALRANFSASNVHLTLIDGRSVLLPQTISASGARYSNPDESFVFWNKGSTAVVEESGKETYSECVTQST